MYFPVVCPFGCISSLPVEQISHPVSSIVFTCASSLPFSHCAAGVLRGCGNYPGLDGSWYRTAVRTAPENQQLLKVLQEVLA